MSTEQIVKLLAMSDEDFDKTFKDAHPEAAHLDLDENAFDVLSLMLDKLTKDSHE